jgi:hypothetical protein
MIERIEIINKEREYLGTRYRHQGRLKGVGVDCAGLVICTLKELNLTDYDKTDYGRVPNGLEMQKLLFDRTDYVDSLDDAIDGDIILMRFEKDPQHLGFYVKINNIPGIIHSHAGAKKVVEHNLDELWANRIVAIRRVRIG